jgi:hypothetical protein
MERNQHLAKIHGIFTQQNFFSIFHTSPRTQNQKNNNNKSKFFHIVQNIKSAYTQVPRPMFKYYNSFNQCCGSGSTRLRIYFGRLDPDPHISALGMRIRIQEDQNDPQKK